MALGPIKQGQTRPSWTFTVLQSDNSPLDITGATFAGVLYDKQTATATTLTGLFAITSAGNGVFTYAPVITDVGTPGVFDVEIKITIAGGLYYFDAPQPLVIKERYAA